MADAPPCGQHTAQRATDQIQIGSYYIAPRTNFRQLRVFVTIKQHYACWSAASHGFIYAAWRGAQPRHTPDRSALLAARPAAGGTDWFFISISSRKTPFLGNPSKDSRVMAVAPAASPVRRRRSVLVSALAGLFVPILKRAGLNILVVHIVAAMQGADFHFFLSMGAFFGVVAR